MKKNYKTTIGVFALAAIALTGSQIAANAYQGDYTKQGPNYSEERHTTMTQAFESGDYNTWKGQMDGRGRVTAVVTEENFARFAEAHRLGLAGDTAGADAIRAELGLRTSNGEKGGHGYGKGEGQGRGQGENRGQNKGGNFVDADGNGTCDNMN
ncbi:MAG: hypothetical protein ACKUBY_03020 [Candidatus Moraniibacteriota bacterium]|jgi:hypothetical protein